MEWYEDEEFWKLTYPLMFPASRIDEAQHDLQHLLELIGMDNGTVLDLCCGPGRFSIPLSRAGFRVTGLDSTEYLLNVAENRARQEGLDIEWIRSDMRNFRRENGFDLILNMFTSFGYFQRHDDNVKVLRNCRDSLNPGGKFLIETMGKEILASIFLPVTCDETEEGMLLVQRHRISDDWNRIENDWILIEDDRILGRWKFSHWLYSAAELTHMLKEAGFGIVEVYGDLEGGCYGPDASRLVALATSKPS